MRLMKKDMGGAATLLGLAQAVMEAKLPLRLRLLMPAVENSRLRQRLPPAGCHPHAQGHHGRGRQHRCRGPAHPLRCARRGLRREARSHHRHGDARPAPRAWRSGPTCRRFSPTTTALAADLLRAGAEEGDPLWRLPLWQPYRDWLEESRSPTSTTSRNSPFAGAITAALYLARVRGAGRSPGRISTLMPGTRRRRPGRPEGGEALGVRALYALIERRFAPAGS